MDHRGELVITEELVLPEFRFNKITTRKKLTNSTDSSLKLDNKKEINVLDCLVSNNARKHLANDVHNRSSKKWKKLGVMN